MVCVQNVLHKLLSILQGEKIHIQLFLWVPNLSVGLLTILFVRHYDNLYEVDWYTLIFGNQVLQNDHWITFTFSEHLRTLTLV